MNIKTGMTKDGRTVEVELGDQDGHEQFPDWENMKTAHKFRALIAFGDMLVMDYARSERLLPEDYARQRLQELAEVVKKFR